MLDLVPGCGTRLPFFYVYTTQLTNCEQLGRVNGTSVARLQRD